MQIISIPEKLEKKPVEIADGEHLLGEFVGDQSGATLIIFGSVHGNETSGVRAIRRILPKLENLKEKLRGRVFLLAGNTRALQKGLRFIDSDLNRHWTDENIKHNRPDSHITTNRAEDIEQKELLAILEKAIATAKDEVYAMDLHSTSADGVPFATVGDTLRNREFAQKFPATILLGIEEQLDGTILEYLNNKGAVTFGFEGGQHYAESTVDNHEALIWFGLVNAGILQKEEISDFEKHRKVLEKATGKPRIVEIRYRHAVTETDDFKMELGYENFQPIKRGEFLANDKHGAIRANESGLILMPLYQKLGEDGFFLGREVAPFWLWLSGILRKLKIGNLMRFLPGVQKSPFGDETLEINTRIARIFPLQIFHLLGFRKRRWRDNKLTVSRRKFDTKSPFLEKRR